MKYAYQVMVIGGISFVGEILNRLLPVPVPASVYGMLLLLICLCAGIIKLEQIQESADFLLAIMPLVFVAPGVALMESFGLMKDSIVGIFVVSIVSTIAVMVICGWIVQLMVRRKGEGEESHE